MHFWMCSGNLKFENMVIKGRKTPIFELLGVIYNEVMSYYYFITPLTLKYIVAEMDNKESFDLFEMSNSLIKKIINTIAEPLSHVFNCSIMSGVIPSQLKDAKVIPIYL